MKFTKIVLATCLLFELSYADMSDAYDKTTDSKKIGWMQKGMEAVRMKLKDSKSAKFRNVYFHRGKDDIPMTCGEVNSNNSFGGKAGYQKFLSAGRVDVTYLEEEISDGISQAWNQFCK